YIARKDASRCVPAANPMQYLSNVLRLAICHVVLTGACSMDSELSPIIPSNAVANPDDELDAGAAESSKREARKIAPAVTLRDAGAATRMATTNPDPHAAERGPYNEDNPWSGYLWIAKTGTGTTLTASKTFQDKSFDQAVCIQGSVAATADSSGNAMLGMNVNQAERTNATPLVLVPTLDGVQVDVKNSAGSQLRVQVAGPAGAADADARWCAVVNGSGGFIPWTAFNTACWDGSGKAYKQQEISVAMLLVPGNAQGAVTYDFCLQRLAEADAPTPGVGAGSAPPDNSD
ncbi:MAG TPA: hypothetical protein VMF89_18845, partial [Polyangiales bacterium]|nr:hypothetical protein [Polyangiales bacterium]